VCSFSGKDGVQPVLVRSQRCRMIEGQRRRICACRALPASHDVDNASLCARNPVSARLNRSISVLRGDDRGIRPKTA
jgi:hypothetical protein